MQIALFGGTRGVGRQFLTQALTAGHSVTVLARTPQKLDDLDRDALSIVSGDVLDPSVVGQTVAGADAAVVSLGQTGDNPDNVVSKGTANVVQAMKAHGIQRLIIVSSLGVGDSSDQVPFFFKLIMKTFLRKTMQDKERQEEIVRDSGLQWTIVRPGGLGDGPKSGQYTVSAGDEVTAGRVNRADVADMILRELTAKKFVRQAVAVT